MIECAIDRRCTFIYDLSSDVIPGLPEFRKDNDGGVAPTGFETIQRMNLVRPRDRTLGFPRCSRVLGLQKKSIAQCVSRVMEMNDPTGGTTGEVMVVSQQPR
jgi:hypothetical protein